MKKLLIVVLMSLALIGCQEEKTDMTKFDDIIKGIGEIDYLDTEWDEDYVLDVRGNGAMAYLLDNCVSALYVEGPDIAMIDYSFENQFLSNKIKIDYISIGFTNFEFKQFVEITFDAEGYYNIDFTSDEFMDYLLTFNALDIKAYLIANTLLDKE